MPCASLLSRPPTERHANVPERPRHSLAFTPCCFPYRINAHSGLSRGTPMMNDIHASDMDNSLDVGFMSRYITP
jgi:hypothetical protein